MRTLKTDVIKIGELEVEIFNTDGTTATVVFVNGFRMELSNWSRVIDDLSKKDNSIRLISYNRPGIGKSSKAETRQQGIVVINDMKHTLDTIGITYPIILVAHSLGGIFANLYTRKYPSDVGGVIFVDAPHTDEILEQKAQATPFMLSALNNGFKFIEKLLSPYKFSEDEEITATIEQINDAKSFPPIPVTVITGMKKMPFVPDGAMATHQKHQKNLLELSPVSTHLLAKSSGHFPQIDEPELVSEAILTMIERQKMM